ncbi:MAG: LacI family DNA-binding transcriptional regulator [Microbacteriaceae bacterium]
MGAKSSNAPTIYDVASRAGLSHQTVSRYLSGFEGMRSNTRDRVAQAIVELGYKPNLSARSLATNRSYRIAALTSDLLSAGPSQTIQGLANAARAAGYLVDIVAIDMNRPESLEDVVRLLRSQDFVGIVAIAVSDAMQQAIASVDFGVPLYVDSGPADLSGPVGESFNALGTEMLVDHLVELGHTSIMHLSGPLGWVAARNRVIGFTAAARRHNLPTYPTMEGDWSPKSGYEAITSTTIDPSVTAIVVGNDQMALGALHALKESGRETPQDISITGFDDIQEAAFYWPSLTTVRIDFERQGTFLFDSLLASINGSVAPESSQFMRPELIVRKSTSTPPTF